MIAGSPIYNMNYFTEIKLKRMLVLNNFNDDILLFKHSTIHNFTSKNEEMLIVDHQQFQIIFAMIPKEDAKTINELLVIFWVQMKLIWSILLMNMMIYLEGLLSFIFLFILKKIQAMMYFKMYSIINLNIHHLGLKN
jgi:hypothetical protein